MSWPDVTVVLGGLATLVSLTYVVLPYVRSRSEEQRREEALKAVNQALGAVNKRVEILESMVAERRLPTALGRRSA